MLRLRRLGVTVSDGVFVGRDVRVEISGDATLELGQGLVIGDGCRILVRGGAITIGGETVLGERCLLVAHAAVEIGRRCRLGDGVVIVDADPAFADVDRPIREQGMQASAVALGDDVRAGHGAVVLRGVHVGSGGSIGAHSVVTSNVPPGAVAAGVPARAPRRGTHD